MSAAWSWSSVAGDVPASDISKVATHLSTCPVSSPDGQVDRSLRPLEYTADDWREFYAERAAVAEHDGGMERAEAERMAYEACLARWQDMNPPAITPDACTHCGQPSGVIGRDAVIIATGHYLHHACHTPWLARRRENAIMALVNMDITRKRTHDT